VVKITSARGAILVLGLLFPTFYSHAATFIALTTDQMIENSASVVQGRVVDMQSSWDEGGRLIITNVTVQVTETIIGQAGPRIVVQTPGGTVGDFEVEAEGFPQLTQREEVILFIEQGSNADFHRITGHQQGHIEVVRRRDGVALAVPRVEGGVSYLTPSGQPMPQMPSTELELFKSRLKSRALQLGKPVN
jgi:hypothetical protein